MHTVSLHHYLFVFMGVSGSGKSTVANTVAYKLQAAVLDGDFLHPRSNIKKMASGCPLNDDDRRPWLESINAAAFAMQCTNQVSLIVCSALKKSYRNILRSGHSNLFFIYLRGDFNIIKSRLQARKGHFFQPQMLRTQFAVLEPPEAEEKDVFSIDIYPPIDEVISITLKTIEKVIKNHNISGVA
ncbi:gluconokinase [Candidatus Erwinia haradaeae]|uniref:Gluconokinase n=1 Tax=Candidatus Erwinia haradaeae TaxID=1922217 RepID=A0A451D7D0_9GAMM|nr:gluconokinase [Candidatus Erwinia haradaeae]VFP81706.1 Thermoresistant gluconokinase [Candidatus Erwinia haradaeae]